jgi:hypothetical protein
VRLFGQHVVVALAALALSAASGTAASPPGAPRLSVEGHGALVLATPAYRLVLSQRTGQIASLTDSVARAVVVSGENGCLWGALLDGSTDYAGGCSFAPRGSSTFTYRWNRAASTLTLAYRSGPTAVHALDAVVTITAAATSLDLRLTLENRSASTIRNVLFPADLMGPTATVQAGYTPKFLPGIELAPATFSREGNDITTYPSRWAFADWLAYDAGGGHLALSSVNPAPASLAPVELGFFHQAPPGPCSGAAFCLTHAFDTWTAPGAEWTSPVVRIRIGETVQRSIEDYRTDNGIDGYPSLAAKVGARLSALAREPLLKADPWTGLGPFAHWPSQLAALPGPVLLHPVAYTPGGHDHGDPDFLPPDPIWGTTADFRSLVDAMHAGGSLVMPYLNAGWWTLDSPTIASLPAPLTPADVAVLDERGNPVVNHYGPNYGYTVSPAVPFVKSRVDALIEQFSTEVPADCLFFDQLGALPWLRDLNPAEPTPLSYEDGWLALFAPYADRCLMVEDGWDRLAQSFSGFHGSVLSIAREHDQPNQLWGPGNWRPFPLADWLFHDKVLLYQHDLYDGTMAADLEVLSFDVAFGMQLSYEWNGTTDTLASPWLPLVTSFQEALGPHVAGQPLTSWTDVAPEVTQSVFGDLTTTTNWSATGSYDAGGYGLPPKGFVSRSADGSLVAGAFAGAYAGQPLSPGTHILLVQRTPSSVDVFQPVGADTVLALDPPAAWSPGQPLLVEPLDAAGGGTGAPAAAAIVGGKVVVDLQAGTRVRVTT